MPQVVRSPVVPGTPDKAGALARPGAFDAAPAPVVRSWHASRFSSVDFYFVVAIVACGGVGTGNLISGRASEGPMSTAVVMPICIAVLFAGLWRLPSRRVDRWPTEPCRSFRLGAAWTSRPATCEGWDV